MRQFFLLVPLLLLLGCSEGTEVSDDFTLAIKSSHSPGQSLHLPEISRRHAGKIF
jgi:hypothetical protein